MTTKRRWFQVHLSTVVVMAFVAGVLIFVNVRPRVVDLSHIPGIPSDFIQSEHGWPFWSWTQVNKTWKHGHWKNKNEPLVFEDKGFIQHVPSGWVGNVAFAVVVLFGIAVLCEYLIRRRPQQVQGEGQR